MASVTRFPRGMFPVYLKDRTIDVEFMVDRQAYCMIMEEVPQMIEVVPGLRVPFHSGAYSRNRVSELDVPSAAIEQAATKCHTELDAFRHATHLDMALWRANQC